MKKIIALLLVFVLASGIVFGTSYYSKSDLKGFNIADIYINGIKMLEKGEDFTDASGNVLPSTISFKNTTYVPLKKISETLSLNVIWDGSIKISSSFPTTEVKVVPKEKINYSNQIALGKVPSGYKTLFVEDLKGNIISDLIVKNDKGTLIISNAYKIQRGQKYLLNMVIGTQIDKKEIEISDITLESFNDNGWAWELVVPADSKKGYHHPFIDRKSVV